MADDNLQVGLQVDVSETAKLEQAATQIKGSMDSTAASAELVKAEYVALSEATQNYQTRAMQMRATMKALAEGELPQSATATRLLALDQQNLAEASVRLTAAQKAVKDAAIPAAVAIKEEVVATKNLSLAMNESAVAANRWGSDMMQARMGAMLLGREVGVTVPRALTTIISRSELMGKAFTAAFSTIAIIGFIQLAIQLGEKLGELGAKLFVFSEAEKDSSKTVQGEYEKQIKLLEQIGRQQLTNALIGKTPAQQAALKFQWDLRNLEVAKITLEQAEAQERVARAHVEDLKDQQANAAQLGLAYYGVAGYLTGAAVSGRALKKELDDANANVEAVAAQTQTARLAVMELENDAKGKHLTEEFKESKQHAAELKKNLAETKKLMDGIAHAAKENNAAIVKDINERDKLTTKLLRDELSADFKAGNEKLARLRQQDDEQLAAALKLADDKAKITEQAANFEYRIGAISAAKKEQLDRAAIQREIQEKQDALKFRVALDESLNPDNPKLRQKLNDEVVALDRKRDQQLALETQKHLERVKQQWNQVFGAVTRAADSSVQGMIQGTLTLQQAVSNIGQAILGEFVSMLVTRAAKWVENEIFMAIFGQAVGKAAGATDIATAAAVGAANAWASTAAIPLIGPELAPAAAAATYSGIIAEESLLPLETGTDYVPRTGVAMLHKGEAVMDSNFAQGLRELLGQRSSNASSPGPDQSAAMASVLNKHGRQLRDITDGLRDVISGQKRMMGRLRLAGVSL